MKRILVALGALALAGHFAHAADDAKPTIPIIVKSTTISYFQTVLAGARKAGKELGVTVPELGPDAISNVASQISILENAVAGKPSAVVITPSDADALAAPITEAAKKVPIVGADSGANTDAFVSMITTDNAQGGRTGADALAQAVIDQEGKPEGKVALLVLVPGNASLNQRASGFKEQLAANYPGLELIAERIGDGQPTTGLNITSDLITANPDLVGVFCTDFVICAGAGQAIAEGKLQDTVAVVSFDADDAMLGYLAEGVVDALIVQDPFRMGFEGIKMALAASKGVSVPKLVDTGVTVITRENVDEPRSQELLNPKVD